MPQTISPRQRPHAIAYVFIILTIFTPHALGQAPSVSLTDFTAFSVQRTCVQNCLIGPQTDGHYGVLRSLGCSGRPMLHSCYCDSGFASTISAGFSSCINSYCGSKSADLASALSLYTNYCAEELTFVTSAATASLSTDPVMEEQPTCIQACMMSRPSGGGLNLPLSLQCASPVYNDCLCRTDLASEASKHLTSCINKECPGNKVRIASAISLYESYCKAARAEPTQNNGEDGTQPTAKPGGSTSDNPPSETGSNGNGGENGGTNLNGDNPSESKPSISTAAIVGISVGAAAILIISVGGFLIRWRRARRHPSPPVSIPAQHLAPPQSNYTSPSEPSRLFYPIQSLQSLQSLSSTEQNVNRWVDAQTRPRSSTVLSDFASRDGRSDILSEGRC